MNDTDDSDDDFIAATQVSYYGTNGWTSQNHGASTSQRSQNQGTSSQRPQKASTSQAQRNRGAASQRSQNNVASTNQSSQNQETASQRPQKASTSQAQQRRASASQRPQNHGASGQGLEEANKQTNSDWQLQLEKLTQGVTFLQSEISVLKQSAPGKGTKEDKKNKPKEKHPCQLCRKVYANTTNLFRHYKAIHNEFNPEKFGYTVNHSILNIDDSMTQEHRCGICAYISTDKNALDAHMAIVHSNDVRERCQACGYKASSKNDLDNHIKTHVDNDKNDTNDNNNNPIEAIKDKMHKCEECSCYYDDKSKFDEHMKALHGFEFLCKICNKNFRFKDFESHVKDNHPDVLKDKDETVKSNVIVEKNVRTKKGRAIVFKCTKCTERFSSKKEAWRHIMMHKKELRRRDVGSNQASRSSRNREEVNTNNEDILTLSDIIYICEACNIATHSYDVAVEHSQNHISIPNIEFSTRDCGLCCLKFEEKCYHNHIDMHYTNKRANKDSFKYLKYNYHLLLTGDWLNFFNMAEAVVNRIVSRSIYADTRSIKMRAVSGKSNTITLYQCRQCDNFVESSAVKIHALSFDNCTAIRNSFNCNVCQRSFETELARNNHEAVHNDMNDNDSFRIVMFNDASDRGFNYILNAAIPAINNDENEKVIYKCRGCSLCFILKESATNHIKACPGHKQREICLICKNCFNVHEIGEHYYKHHCSKNIRLIINEIVPDVVFLSDDESNNEDDKEALYILSSDEDEKNSDKRKQTHNTDCNSDDDNTNEPLTSETENGTQASPSAEDSNMQPNLLVATDTVRDDIPMDEVIKDEQDQSIYDGNSDHSVHSDFEVSHDDDSQSTIINGESYNIPNLGDVARSNGIKCVETDLLKNPFYVRNGSESIINVDERNETLAADIETTRENIAFGEVNVKKEIPEDNNMNRRNVKQMKVENVTSTDSIINLMTDDEDEAIEFTQVDERTNVHVNTGAYNLENIITNNDAHNSRNVQTNIVSNLIEAAVNILVNETSRDTALSDRRTVVNTGKKRETKIKMKLAQNEENENGSDDSEIEEINNNGTMIPFRNGINDADDGSRFIVNNLEIQFSGQNDVMKPNCNIC